MPSTRFDRELSRSRAVLTALFALVVVGLLLSASPSLPLVLLGALTVLYFGASAFDVVRSHPAFPLASAAYTVLLFGLWYAISDSDGPLLLVFTALAAAGFAVEAYNYRYGTSYLRFDF